MLKLKRAKTIYLFLLITLCLVTEANAQYYDWGQNPGSLKWKQIKGKGGKIVFPEAYSLKAVRLMHYMDSVRAHVGYGYTHGPMKLPLVLHTQNFQSNGIVMLAPNRMEFIVTPPPTTAAMPWLKQLAVHEYRHAVQYNNLNKGFIKALSYVLGQHGSLLGLGLMPTWAIEGDAVMAETQMSSFGRGLQPSFTIDYRAMVLEGQDKKYRSDKYFCGSFKDKMPDHYALGYQMSTYAYTKYGENIWNKITRFAARNPYLIFTSTIGLHKFYRTSADKLLKETFEDLGNYWRSLPLVDNSSDIAQTPATSFTTYSSPISIDDSTAVVLKSDFDRTSRIVEVNLNRDTERVLYRTGSVSTPMTLQDGVLVWSEYRSSVFWSQRVNSVPCFYDLKSGKGGAIKSERRAMFSIAMPQRKVAIVEYDYSGDFLIKYNGWHVEIPDTVSVHGLAYDKHSKKFYFIALSDAGMWIGAVRYGSQEIEIAKPANYSTIANLRADSGRLYFNSIASGKDEAHFYDIAEQREYQITTSRYGSFEPSPTADPKRVLVTTYTPRGYMLATQSVDQSSTIEIPHTLLPRDVVNPPRIKWDVPNVDLITVSDSTTLPIKKYRKNLKLFRFHSFAPVYYKPDFTLYENDFSVNIGATIMSQNLLNSVFTTIGYKYTNAGSLFSLGMRYYALAPKFEVEAEYGTMSQLLYVPANVEVGDLNLKNYFNVVVRGFLPIRLSSGYRFKSLVPSVEFEHLNAKLTYSAPNEPFRGRNGMQKLKASLQYSDNTRMAFRDLLPRWGYSLRATYTMSPFNANFGRIFSGYARAYIPGLMPHHSLMLRGAAQYQDMGRYNFRQKELFPRGARYNFTPDKYASLSVDYQMPIWYPDGGINAFLYFKRIRANLSYDFARYKTPRKRWKNIYSYGIDIIFDISPMRIPSSINTTVEIKLHKPSDRKGVVIEAAFSMPL